MSGRTKLTFMQKIKSLALVSGCSTGVFVIINLYKGNDQFYDNILMPIISKCIDPETAHKLAVLACKYNIFPMSNKLDPENLKISLFGQQLNNPIGIAAGFDKHGEAITGLNRLGFGFIEIGSVTPQPQMGNEKPRVFRLSEDQAIINRYGFNSDGHDIVMNRLSVLRKNDKRNICVGVNLGKNKVSTDPIDDYIQGIRKFSPYADYLVINVSSPNTIGLRNLQQKNELKMLLVAVQTFRNTLPIDERRPILLKLAPDLSELELQDIANVINDKKSTVDGLIIANTTVTRDPTLKNPNFNEIGGLSGRPLTDISTVIIGKMYHLTNGKIPIIGVGGIFTGKDAYEKILAGATAIQLYTAFTIHGPPIILKIKNELNDLLRENGYSNVTAAVGKDFKKYI